MREANLLRRKQSALHDEAKALEVTDHARGAAGREHAGDVLNEDKPRAGLDDDAAGVAPEVSFVFAALAFSGLAVRLARDAANDAIHDAAPWPAVKGSGIAPDRSVMKETASHRRNQVRDGEGFPLHHADCSSSRDREFKSHVEPSAAGAEAEDVEAGR